MTTEYRDKNGKLLRTEPGTLPRGAAPAAPVKRAPEPQSAPAESTDTAPARAGKE